ncbi:hypothetical protein AAY473_023130 [Plecturocebus cupreus]
MDGDTEREHQRGEQHQQALGFPALTRSPQDNFTLQLGRGQYLQVLPFFSSPVTLQVALPSATNGLIQEPFCIYNHFSNTKGHFRTEALEYSGVITAHDSLELLGSRLQHTDTREKGEEKSGGHLVSCD